MRENIRVYAIVGKEAFDGVECMKILHNILLVIFLLAISLSLVGTVMADPSAGSVLWTKHPVSKGAVYTEDNAASNNVLRFAMLENGKLGPATSFSTGGSGTGTAFHSQGAIVLTDDGRWLLAVDAGSNEITVFKVTPEGLTMADKVSSHGMMPISITVQGPWVYVLDSASLNIAGFILSPSGQLNFIKGSNLSLNKLASAPEQIGFGNWFDSSVLIVTEKGSNQIDTFTVNRVGIPTGPFTTTSNGNGPYGFAFEERGILIDSDAGSHAASSYGVSHNGVISVISGPVATGVANDTPCWVAITDNGKFAYTGNGDTAISSFSVSDNGVLKLVNEKAATLASGGSLDLGFSEGSRYLYVLNAAGSISGFGVDKSNGILTLVTTASGVPLSSAGIAVS